MLIQQLASSQAEAVFVVGQNNSSATLTGNSLVCFESIATITSNVSFGNGFNNPTTSNLAAFAGVLNADVATGAFGLIQVYGARQSIAANVGAASISAQGLILGPLAANVSAQSTGRSFGLGPIVVLDNDLSASVYLRGFIRAL